MEFRGYSLRYRSDMDPVLRDISIVVHGGEKVSSRQCWGLEAAVSLQDGGWERRGFLALGAGGSREAGEGRSSSGSLGSSTDTACPEGICVARPLQGP